MSELNLYCVSTLGDGEEKPNVPTIIAMLERIVEATAGDPILQEICDLSELSIAKLHELRQLALQTLEECDCYDELGDQGHELPRH